MKFTMRSLFSLSEEDKREILGAVAPSAPPEDVMTINKEVWQQVMGYLSRQEKEIQLILTEMSETKKNLYELKTIVENQSVKPEKNDFKQQLAVLSESNLLKKEIKFTKTEPQNKTDKTVKAIDRSNFAMLVDGEKEVKEISDSWEDIFASINDGTYREKYKIGNYKPLDLGGEGIIRMQIAGFDAEVLAYGSGRAAITWIAMDLLKTEHRMNPMYENKKIGTGGLGGWKESEMRKYLDTEIKPLIPLIVKSQIKPVRKYSFSCNTATREVSNEITEDELWIPAVKEIAENSQTRKLFSKYEKDAVYYSSLFSSEEDRKRGSFWWLRSVANFYSFYSVYQNGAYGNSYPQYTYGVVLCFCTYSKRHYYFDFTQSATVKE